MGAFVNLLRLCQPHTISSSKPNEIYCTHCHKLGHWASQCPNKGKPAGARELPAQEHIETKAELSIDLRQPIDKLESRIAALEERVERLEARKRYMREYQRRRRAK